MAAMLFVLTGMPSEVVAQAYQCRVPARISVPPIRPDGPVRTMPIAGYTMAASWSPEYCRTRKTSRRDARQCSGRSGRFGFVQHGLWPNGRGERWPQWCPTSRRPTGALLARQMCRMPSDRLAARQWAKHGSCSGLTPAGYFKVSAILWDGIRWPDADRLSRREGLTAGMLREEISSANPGWFPAAIGIKRNRRGWLQEVRLCYAKDFMPTRCTRSRYGAGDNARLKIWRGL